MTGPVVSLRSPAGVIGLSPELVCLCQELVSKAIVICYGLVSLVGVMDLSHVLVSGSPVTGWCQGLVSRIGVKVLCHGRCQGLVSLVGVSLLYHGAVSRSYVTG